MLQEATGTIAVPTNFVLAMGSLIAGSVLSGISFCGHLLISMNRKLSQMATDRALFDLRITAIEREIHKVRD